MEKYDIPLERIYALGIAITTSICYDMYKTVLRWASGTEEVAEAASYRTDTVEQDGIEKAMRHFGMIE